MAGGHYHLINRGNNRAAIFADASDYGKFVRLIAKAQARVPLRILAACLMPNHFHLVVAQDGDRDISRWMHWLLTTHANHHHLRHGSSGRVWQGRFKAFAIEQDTHLLTVMRYVERNALRAGLVERAEAWTWGSLHWRLHCPDAAIISQPPVVLPSDWSTFVNEPQTAEELASIRTCVNGQRPFGDEAWTTDTARRSGQRVPGNHRGRPRKPPSITAK